MAPDDYTAGFRGVVFFGAGFFSCVLIVALIQMSGGAPFGRKLADLMLPWQTLAGSILGFGGVACTLWYNAMSGRRQHDREVEHEANILRTALVAELELVRSSLVGYLKRTDSPGPDLAPPLQSITIYQANAAELGRLGRMQAKYTVQAYARVDQLDSRVKLLLSFADDLPEHLRGRPLVPAEDMKYVRALCESAVQYVDFALGSLEGAAIDAKSKIITHKDGRCVGAGTGTVKLEV